MPQQKKTGGSSRKKRGTKTRGTNILLATTALSALVLIGVTSVGSTYAWSAANTVLTVTLQGVANAGTVAGPSTATGTPGSALASATGEAIDTPQTPSVTAILF